MRTRWFGDLPEDEELSPSLRELAEAVSGVLDRLRPAAVAPGSGRVVPEVPAVVVPHARIPGCSLVLQVSDWSSSVGCWWSRRTDPRDGPPTLELFAEFPLQPDGIASAAGWFEQELRRPLAERVRRLGLACRRDWLVVLDDGYREPLWGEWLPWWRRPSWARNAVSERDAGWLATPDHPSRPRGEGGEPEAGERAGAPTDRWLLAMAAAAAVAAWASGFGLPELDGGGWGAWLPVRGLRVAAFALLLIWFGVAALDCPPRVRVPVLVGLMLSILRLGFGYLAGPPGLVLGADSTLRALGLLLRVWWPDLLSVAALACYLVAFLGMPPRAAVRRAPPRPLLVATAASVWLADLVIGLGWLTPIPTGPNATPTLTLLFVLLVASRAIALGIAVASLVVVVERGAGMAPGAVRLALTGAGLLALSQAAMVQVGLVRLAGELPPVLLSAIVSVLSWLAFFAGTALVVVAAAWTGAALSQRDGAATGVPAPPAC